MQFSNSSTLEEFTSVDLEDALLSVPRQALCEVTETITCRVTCLRAYEKQGTS